MLIRDHFWLVYTLQLNPPLGTAKSKCHLNLGNLMNVQERHITNSKCQDSGVHGQFDRSSPLWEIKVLASLSKGVQLPAYFDYRGWFRAGLPFFRGDMTLSLPPLSHHYLLDISPHPLLLGCNYDVTGRDVPKYTSRAATSPCVMRELVRVPLSLSC
ncbi:hypothetical protein J6590_071428 [Homalodisca vitripennis]|nr:hypothetical protein J6590_071428 [Homalodisca vitripennis]